MALVVFEVESLSKVMTNMNHMSFDSLDEVTVGQANIFKKKWFNLLYRLRSVLTLQGPRKCSRFRLSEELESIRGSCVWVQSGGARTSKVSEISAVSEVIETMKREGLQRPRKCLAENF